MKDYKCPYGYKEHCPVVAQLSEEIIIVTHQLTEMVGKLKDRVDNIIEIKTKK